MQNRDMPEAGRQSQETRFSPKVHVTTEGTAAGGMALVALEEGNAPAWRGA